LNAGDDLLDERVRIVRIHAHRDHRALSCGWLAR